MKLNGATTTRSRQGVQLGVIATLLAFLFIAAQAPNAHAARPLDVGFADDAMYQGGVDPKENHGAKTVKQAGKWLDKTVDVNAGIIRVNLYWSLVAPTEPADPTNPGDPAYDFTAADIAITEAEERDLDVLLTVLSAPPWAEGPDRPSFEEIRPGAWDPDPIAFGKFGSAVAKRYSGDFTTADGADLPEVEYFQAWNEPNLNTYIAPQWDGEENLASDIFVGLLNHFYDAVKTVNPDAQVVTGGVSPYGDPPGGPNRTRPLRFLRELLCLNEKLKRGECPNGGAAPQFDVIAQHPINREDSPTTHAVADDDVEVADFGDVTKTLRAAEKLGTPAIPGKHEVFADEVWWQTNPPDKAEGVALDTHARWVAQSLYMLWDAGASKVIFHQFRDAKYTPGEFSLASYQTGVYTYEGKRKPTADAIRFPFVTERQGTKLLAWGKAPDSGKLTIEVKDGSKFEKVSSFKVKEDAIFTKKLNLPGSQELRARVGKDTSLVWKQKG